MKTKSFPTPQDCEAAFYEALEANNLEAMMEVWAEDEEIICVHPGGPRLSGYEQVRASWAAICGSGQRLKVQITQPVITQSMMSSVHSVHETLSLAGDAKATQTVVTTNVYIRTANGWRMIVHHAAPVPQPPRPSDAPKILH